MRKARLWLCAASALWACGDGQAEDDYLGEPLLVAQGSVVASDLALTRDLILSLLFIDYGQPGASSSVMHYVKSEVVGSFPSDFTMRIYDPPPPEVLVAPVPGEPAFATGELLTVRRDHPDWLRQETTFEAGQPKLLRTCAPNGACRERDLNAPECASPPDYRACPVNDAWTDYHSSSGGSDSLHATLILYDFMYFADAAPAGGVLSKYFASGQAIGKGYHLLIHRLTPEVVDDPDDVAASLACSERARQRANAAINVRHGRDPAANAAEADPVTYALEYPGESIIAVVAEGCPGAGGVWVEDPSQVSLGLSFFGSNGYTP
jgi:hypothetical protein